MYSLMPFVFMHWFCDAVYMKFHVSVPLNFLIFALVTHAEQSIYNNSR